VIFLACTIEAVRIDRVGEADRFIRIAPNKNIPPAKQANVIAPFRNLFQVKFWAHIQLTRDANQVIKKEIPQMPVTEVSCINGRLPA
jgi:hypothetical protein